jgi:hypothetical protein
MATVAEKPAGVNRGLGRERGPQPVPLSVEPLSAAVDLLMKRAVSTLRFYIRRPRFPQAGLSPFASAALRAGGGCGTSNRGWVSAETVMNERDAGFDYERYRKLLAEATDETKRLALIDLLINEKAKDSLALQLVRDRVAELGLTRFKD